LAIKLSKQYGNDADYLYHHGPGAIIPKRRANFIWEAVGTGLVAAIGLASTAVGAYQLDSMFFRKARQLRRIEKLRAAAIAKREIQDFGDVELHKVVSREAGKKGANLLQGAAAESTGQGVVDLNSSERRPLLGVHTLQKSSADPRLKPKSILQQFFRGSFNGTKSTFSNASYQPLRKVEERDSIGWVRKTLDLHRQRYGCDTKINFVERYKKRFGTKQYVDYDKAWRFITDGEDKGGLGFYSIGHTDHPKLWHPEFPEPPPKASRFDCAAQFYNKHFQQGKATPVDMKRWMKENQELFGSDLEKTE